MQRAPGAQAAEQRCRWNVPMAWGMTAHSEGWGLGTRSVCFPVLGSLRQTDQKNKPFNMNNLVGGLGGGGGGKQGLILLLTSLCPWARLSQHRAGQNGTRWAVSSVWEGHGKTRGTDRRQGGRCGTSWERRAQLPFVARTSSLGKDGSVRNRGGVPRAWGKGS